MQQEFRWRVLADVWLGSEKDGSKKTRLGVVDITCIRRKRPKLILREGQLNEFLIRAPQGNRISRLVRVASEI